MPDTIVTVATFATTEEAHIALNCLLAAGIDSVIIDENIVALDFRLGPAVGGIKLQVHRDDSKQAVSILKETVYSKKPREKKALTVEEMARLAYRAAAFGLILAPLQFYSMWFIFRLLFHPQKLSPSIRRRILISGFLNLWVVIFIALLIYLF